MKLYSMYCRGVCRDIAQIGLSTADENYDRNGLLYRGNPRCRKPR